MSDLQERLRDAITMSVNGAEYPQRRLAAGWPGAFLRRHCCNRRLAGAVGRPEARVRFAGIKPGTACGAAT
jgi:hypothetical protein